MNVRVVIDGFDCVHAGVEHCYRDHDRALRRSAGVTVRPEVWTLDYAGEPVWLAFGDWWIDSEGRRGRHVYGKWGRYVTVIKACYDGKLRPE